MPCNSAIPCLPPFSIGFSLGFGGKGLPNPPNAGLSLGASSSCGSVSFPTPPAGSGGGPSVGLGVGLAFPIGFPEDLLCILDLLQLLVPPGPLMPQLSLNFGKDIFDAIMKLLDQFMPFLMLYKFFLPILELIICIIEVLCALVNPFAVIGALDRLFTQCIPAFLNLFPIFALIIMIISLLLLLLALIEYLIEQIICFILALIKNILALVAAFEIGSAVGVLAIANKLASLLCIFQNLFVLLALFGIIIQIIKDILSLVFAIPPCEGGNNSNCCGPLTCPALVQNNNSSTTGNMLYYTAVEAPVPGWVDIPGITAPVIALRPESWQVYDYDQVAPLRFWDIVEAQDVIDDGYVPPPVYFPTSQVYTADTPINQAAYTVNLRLFYNPIQWGRTGTPQYLRFNNCIVLAPPTQELVNGQLVDVLVPNGVLYVAGGQGFLDDGKTIIDGYQPDGVTPLGPGFQASLNNWFHKPPPAAPSFDDGYTFTNVSYTWAASTPVLMQANLVTAGCMPQISLNRNFVNNTMFANIASQTQNLKNLINQPPNTQGFPDPAGAQQCLQAAISTLRGNMTIAGVSDFQAMADICLSNLQNATYNGLQSMIGIGFSPCNSNFTLTPNSQFTTLPIQVQVNLTENNGLPLGRNLPSSVATTIAAGIVGYPTFGELSPFTYDGYQYFNANLTSSITGSGSIMIAFQNQILCTNNLPSDGTNPSHTLQSLDYDFVYVPTVTVNIPGTGEGDTVGVDPRRGASTQAGDGGGGG